MNIFKTLFSKIWLIVSTVLKILLTVIIMPIPILLTIAEVPIVLFLWCIFKLFGKEFEIFDVLTVPIFIGLWLIVGVVWDKRFWGP